METKRQRVRKGFANIGRHRKPLTADQRAEFARERRALVGKLILQEGFEGALVIEHIRGSQYLLRLPDGSEVYASHKKPQQKPGKEAITDRDGTWALWEPRS